MAVDRILSPRQFGMEVVPQHPVAPDYDRGPVGKRVRLDKVVTDQTGLLKSHLDYVTKHPRKSNEYVLPTVVRHNGTTHVWDGNHRIATALSRGQKTIRADVYSAKENG